MASPVDADRAGTNISTAADPWVVNWPASVAAGDLLILYFRSASSTGTAGASTPSGWNGLTGAGVDNVSPDASDDINGIYWRTADGSETGTFNLDMGGSTKGATIIWRITDGGSTTPEASSATVTTVANINPGTFSPGTPGGSQDYLWLNIVGMDSETGTATNGTLSNVTSANSGTGGAVATNCIIWGGTLASTASSIDIAAWTSSAPANGASTWTFAIYPAAAAAFIKDPWPALQAVNRSSVY